ncbi:hypothetical protein GQ600_2930 [Phytophthora cactorum]|nr:hypothetical protein GQ600_2930 [Phytophthora cactorum]
MTFVTGVAKKGHGGNVIVSVGVGDTNSGGDVNITAGDTSAAAQVGGGSPPSRIRDKLIRAMAAMGVLFKFAEAKAWVERKTWTWEEWFM